MTVLQHLHSRYMDTNLHKVWINEKECIATFPIWNLSGQLVGYQRYRPDKTKERNNDPREGRYFTRLKDSKVGVWGLESWYLSNTLFVTEGIFDACRITNHGVSAIAVFGNDIPPTTLQWIKCIGKSRNIVAVCDNDAAGSRLARVGNLYHTVKGYKDLGEASEDYVIQLIREYE